MSAFMDKASNQISASTDMADAAIMNNMIFTDRRAVLLERILQEKGFNVQAEMEALAKQDASGSSSWQAASAPILSFFPDEFSPSTAPMIVVTPPSASKDLFRGSTERTIWPMTP